MMSICLEKQDKERRRGEGRHSQEAEHLKDLADLQRVPVALSLDLCGSVYTDKHLK